jgi:putative transposase
LDDLREAGEPVSRKRVARLMTERNLVGEMKKRWRHPSSAPSDAVVAPNTLDRAFNVPEPNRVRASDITYVRTHEGWLYLAVVIDLFSRRVVGWSIQPSMDTDIVLSALTMAVRPAPARTGAAAALRPRLPVHERRLSTGATRSWHRVQLQRPG